MRQKKLCDRRALEMTCQQAVSKRIEAPVYVEDANELMRQHELRETWNGDDERQEVSLLKAVSIRCGNTFR